MEAEGKGERAEGNGIASWSPNMSSFMLSYLVNLIASGTRTSGNFKQMHYNMCARALNEEYKTSITGDQIKNHLKTWQRRYQKVLRLSKISGALFDEENGLISLDQEHYNNHVKDHKSDAEFFNKLIEHYAEMAVTWGNSMATGKYVKSSTDPLGMEEDDTEDREEDTPDDIGASSSASKPKRAKTIIDLEDDNTLVGVLKYVGDKLPNAIEKVAAPAPPPPPADELPEDLLDVMTSLPGFEEAHISYYYAYLVANPHIAKAFYKLPFNHKLNWVAFFVADKFPGN